MLEKVQRVKSPRSSATDSRGRCLSRLSFTSTFFPAVKCLTQNFHALNSGSHLPLPIGVPAVLTSLLGNEQCRTARQSIKLVRILPYDLDVLFGLGNFYSLLRQLTTATEKTNQSARSYYWLSHGHLCEEISVKKSTRWRPKHAQFQTQVQAQHHLARALVGK
jgi:hypothetical protein